jgi:hypothetical protein
MGRPLPERQERDTEPPSVAEPFGWLKIWSFSLLTAGLVAATFLVYPPSDNPGPLLTKFEIQTNPDYIKDAQGEIHLQQINYSESHVDSGVSLAITAYFDRMPVGPTTPFTLNIPLPFGAGAISWCDQHSPPAALNCSIGPTTYLPFPKQLEIGGFTFDPHGITDRGAEVYAEVGLTKSPGIGWRDTHDKFLINLPDCFVANSDPNDTRPHPVSVHANFGFRGTNVAFPGPPDPQPEVGTGKSPYVEYSYDCNTSNSPRPVIGIKEGVDQRDSFRTFVSGALAALAAATGLEVLSEVIGTLDRRRIRRGRRLDSTER